MKKKDKLEKKVVEGLYNYFSKYGYKLTKKNEEFRFSNASSEIRFFQTITRPDCLYFNFYYYAHHKEIDSLVKRVIIDTMPSWMSNPDFFHASRKEYGSKISEMVNCNEFNNPPPYSVEHEIDINKVVNHQQKYFDRVVLKYFEKFRSLESIYDFLSPYLLNLSESHLVYDIKEGLNDYFFPVDYMSLMISCWKSEKSNYPEIWRRIDKIFQGLPIHKTFKLLDSILRGRING